MAEATAAESALSASELSRPLPGTGFVSREREREGRETVEVEREVRKKKREEEGASFANQSKTLYQRPLPGESHEEREKEVEVEVERDNGASSPVGLFSFARSIESSSSAFAALRMARISMELVNAYRS